MVQFTTHLEDYSAMTWKEPLPPVYRHYVKKVVKYIQFKKIQDSIQGSALSWYADKTF